MLGEGFILGQLTAYAIVGLWIIGTGLLEASRAKRRRVLSLVRDEPQAKEDNGGLTRPA